MAAKRPVGRPSTYGPVGKSVRGRPEQHLIYALQDPRDESIRYVGKATDPWKRLREHCLLSNNRGRRHVCVWLRSLAHEQTRPNMLALEWTTDWDSAEIAWIKRLRDEGHDLTNTADGGSSNGHLVRARQNLYGGRWTPLQRRLQYMARTIHSLRRSGYTDAADRVAASRSRAEEAVRRAIAENGEAALRLINDNLARGRDARS